MTTSTRSSGAGLCSPDRSRAGRERLKGGSHGGRIRTAPMTTGRKCSRQPSAQSRDTLPVSTMQDAGPGKRVRQQLEQAIAGGWAPGGG